MEVDQKQARRTKYKKTHVQGTHTNRESWCPGGKEMKEEITRVIIYDSFLDEAKEYDLPENSKFNRLIHGRKREEQQAVEGLLNQLISRNEELQAEPVQKRDENDEEPEQDRLWIKVHADYEGRDHFHGVQYQDVYHAQYGYDGKSVQLHRTTWKLKLPELLKTEENIWLFVRLLFEKNLEDHKLVHHGPHHRKVKLSGKLRADRRSLQTNNGKSNMGSGFAGYDFSNVRFRDCFHGKGPVLMENGSQKRVEDICSGDVVRTASGVSRVECTVKSVLKSSRFCDVNGCLVTPSHPVFIEGAWKTPKTVSPAFKLKVDSVYNFVLESGHSLFINGVECITLGHDNEVHDFCFPSKYQGTNDYLIYLRQHPEYPNIVKYCETKPNDI